MRFSLFAYTKSIKSWKYPLQISKWFLKNCRRYSKNAFEDVRTRRVIILSNR